LNNGKATKAQKGEWGDKLEGSLADFWVRGLGVVVNW
jgi:hypothetical protein